MSYKPAIASMSLGRAWVHKLPYKLDQAQANNLTGVEIFFEDLEYLAREESGISSNEAPSPEAQLHAAETIRKLCDDRELEIIGLQPFMHYEGLLDREEHARRIEKMKLWFKIAKILGTDVIQIPASFLGTDQITGHLDVVVGDLRKVADMGLRESPVIKFAYEDLCWSTYFDTWQKGWDLVERVDRPNFGMCLDTYNISGRVYGDPASPTGKTPNAENDMKASLEELVKRVDVKKIFYIQVVDAEKMRDPLVEGHAFYAADQPARMSWSRNARLFAFEEAGYLPVLDVTRAIIEGLGYKGWVSMELFSRTMNEPGDEVPKAHARRAREAWEKLEREMSNWKIV
ncbi:xylose isomerase-like protein [Rhexocercosporidium sp. MPI-PUGE-AT-0058]|nr:xylose isomerase-like protein [Rhexocercosporidium sp. MPI-PUGE-AT-0058]